MPNQKQHETPNVKKNLLGILGGMGPDATSYFYRLIIEKSPAQNDEDHISTLIFSNTQIPNRQNAIKSGNYQNVIQSLTNSLNTLIDAGADYLVIPCNTAHFFIDQIEPPLSRPILHMSKETLKKFLTLR